MQCELSSMVVVADDAFLTHFKAAAAASGIFPVNKKFQEFLLQPLPASVDRCFLILESLIYAACSRVCILSK